MERKLCLSDFKFLEELGRGSFGVVHRVQHLRSHAISVIKSIPLFSLSSERRQTVFAEVRFLQDLSHPYIVAYEGSFIDNNTLYIVMEYADGGDLNTVRDR